MNISLDYDGTYTRDPESWDAFIKLMRAANHKVYVVTMRYANDAEVPAVVNSLGKKVDYIYFTGRKAKQSFMYALGISIDVWIDDCPSFILVDAKG